MCLNSAKDLDLFASMGSDFNPLYSTIALLQLITDVNIAVAVEAVQAIGNLARGLRTHFSASSRFILPALIVSVYLMLF